MRAIFFVFLTFGALSVWADDLTIFEVRRNIPLSDEDPVYKDYYINGGDKSGLKKDMLVNIFREVTLKDPVEGKEAPKLKVPVGKLRLIYVEDDIAVARLYERSNRDSLPMLEQIGFMIGDQIEVKTAKVEKAPYKFIDDTSRAKVDKQKFTITGESASRSVASVADYAPKPLLPDADKVTPPEPSKVATEEAPKGPAISAEELTKLPQVASEELAKTKESAGPEEAIKQ
jgi:hypothetical protein